MRILSAVSALFAFWLALSGSWQPLDLTVGAAVSLVIGVWAVRFLWAGRAPAFTAGQAFQLLLYVPTFVTTVVTSAVQVAGIVLRRRVPADPFVLTHHTTLSRNLSKVAFANILTVTPGTLTLDVDGKTIQIHCLARGFDQRVTSGELESEIAHILETIER